ncbi:MAG TPA: response regulator transcription factor [Dissulfurispiraceae bacterium]|nr:response regulator transcription factor [Dissulfurispiraceae bacterium]
MVNSILIVDDNDDFRRAAKLVFEVEGFKVLEAKNGFEAIASFKAMAPDLAVVDMKMPGINGIDTIKELKLINSSVPVIILTAYGSIPDAVKAVHGGALDFIQKTAPYDELVALVKKAMDNSCKGVLSPREIEILCWVKEGKSNQEIGQLLNISESTVKAHLKHAYKKLDVTNRAQAMHAAISQGILQPVKRQHV